MKITDRQAFLREVLTQNPQVLDFPDLEQKLNLVLDQLEQDPLARPQVDGVPLRLTEALQVGMESLPSGIQAYHANVDQGWELKPHSHQEKAFIAALEAKHPQLANQPNWKDAATILYVQLGQNPTRVLPIWASELDVKGAVKATYLASESAAPTQPVQEANRSKESLLPTQEREPEKAWAGTPPGLSGYRMAADDGTLFTLHGPGMKELFLHYIQRSAAGKVEGKPDTHQVSMNQPKKEVNPTTLSTGRNLEVATVVWKCFEKIQLTRQDGRLITKEDQEKILEALKESFEKGKIAWSQQQGISMKMIMSVFESKGLQATVERQHQNQVVLPELHRGQGTQKQQQSKLVHDMSIYLKKFSSLSLAQAQQLARQTVGADFAVAQPRQLKSLAELRMDENQHLQQTQSR